MTVQRANAVQPKAANPMGGMMGMPGMMGGMMGVGAVGGMGMGMGMMVPGMMGMGGAIGMGMPGMGMGAPGMGGAASGPPTRVLTLLNMTSADELKDDVEYKEILEDVKTECETFGAIDSLVIPRPGVDGVAEGASCVGKIYVAYTAPESAVAASAALTGRQFGGKVVMTSFYPVEKYDAKEYE